MKFTAVALVLALLAAPVIALAEDCEESTAKGQSQALSSHSSSGFFIGGFFSGVLGGLLGTGITCSIAHAQDPRPTFIPHNMEAECYETGYAKEARSRNTWSAFEGGLIGTGILVTALAIHAANH